MHASWPPGSIELIRNVFEIALRPCETVEKRRLSLALLGEHFLGQCAVWAWGLSPAGSDPVTPVALLDWGMDQEIRTQFIHFGLDPQTDMEFRRPIRERAQQASCITTRRQDLMNDSQWVGSHTYEMLRDMGCEEWLHSVHHPHAEVWATLMLFRRCGAPPFSQSEADVLQLLMSTVPWLDADRTEPTVARAEPKLTSRQRTVLLLLLDGMTRKAIAASLQIHEDTVGDHIKAIFKSFRVRSVTELAAVFLQNK